MKNNWYKWLIDMRWIAASGIMLATLFAGRILSINLQQKQLFLIGALLLFSNLIYLFVYRHLRKKQVEYDEKNLRILVLFQIVSDLLLLTFLLHFSGGVENPFIIYYVFHLMIASIILPRIVSYGIATFTMMLVGLLAGGEYFGWFRHYPLEGFVNNGFYDNIKYLMGTGFIFVTTSYFVVYMTGVISAKLRHKEQAYRQANLDLLEKDKIKNEYVFRITHDIKGHLAAIKNCLDATFVNIPEGKKEEFIKRAHTRTEKLLVFIKDLLRIAQLRLRDTMMKENFSLSMLIHEIVEIHRDTISGKKISIRFDLQVEDLFADRISIGEVFDNLLTNSIKYTNENGSIVIKTSRDSGDKLNIEFSDTGIGIPQKELPHIFDEFYIASNNKGAGTGNTGMGLAIVQNIVKSHKGSIHVKSNEGEGSVFTIRLPAEVIQNGENNNNQ